MWYNYYDYIGKNWNEPENAYRNYRIIIACFILNFIQVTA